VLVIARALRSPVDYPREEEEKEKEEAKENKVAKTRAGREGERSALMRFSSLGVMVIYSRREREGETMSGKSLSKLSLYVCVSSLPPRDLLNNRKNKGGEEQKGNDENEELEEAHLRS
jgi:hypothetical protein